MLRKCYLYNYDFARNLRPDYQGGDRMLIGHKLAIAGGAVLVGRRRREEARIKPAHLGGGGCGQIPAGLVMNPDSQQAR